jgi:hypothetical protein
LRVTGGSKVCQTCTADTDCGSGVCLQLEDGKYCGQDCTTDTDCPAGYPCTQYDKTKPSQCLPPSNYCQKLPPGSEVSIAGSITLTGTKDGITATDQPVLLGVGVYKDPSVTSGALQSLDLRAVVRRPCIGSGVECAWLPGVTDACFQNTCDAGGGVCRVTSQLDGTACQASGTAGSCCADPGCWVPTTFDATGITCTQTN